MNEVGCVHGDFDADYPARIRVALPDASAPYSRTALSHELCHAAQYYQHAVLDYAHEGYCFAPDGGATRVADDTLRVLGM